MRKIALSNPPKKSKLGAESAFSPLRISDVYKHIHERNKKQEKVLNAPNLAFYTAKALGGRLILTLSSRNCSGFTSEGAFIIKSCAR